MRSTFVLTTLSLTAAAFLAGDQARADILARYPFDLSSFASTDAEASSTAAAMSVGSGLSGSSAAGVHTAFSGSQGNPFPSPFVRIPGTTGSEAAAVADNDYFTFTITPNSGLMLNLSSLTLDTAETMGGATTFEGTIFVRSSVDGFASTLGLWTQTSVPTGGGWNARTIDLSGASFQGLATATTFRIYFYDNSDATGDTAAVHRIDNVTLNGTVVPEPSVGALLGLAAVFCGVRRRRASQF